MTQAKIYNFMGLRRYAVVFSALMLVVSSWSLYTQGLVLGLDFSGGTQIEVGYDQPADVGELREKLETAGFDNPVVVHFGSETDVLIRLQGEPDQKLAEQVVEVLQGEDEQIDLRRVDFVGPQIGEELRSTNYWAFSRWFDWIGYGISLSKQSFTIIISSNCIIYSC